MKLSLYGVEIVNEDQTKRLFCSCVKNGDDTWNAFCVALSRDWSAELLKKGMKTEDEIIAENVPHVLPVCTERFTYDVQISLSQSGRPISVAVDRAIRRDSDEYEYESRRFHKK